MPLSDQEIKNLLEKAEDAWDSWCYAPIEDNIRYPEEALEAYNQIIENMPPHPHYFMKRARIKSALASWRDGYLEGAVEDMERAIKIEKASSDDASYWQAKGDTLVNLKRYEEALNAYEKTIELKPDCAEAWKSKGDILKKKFGRYQESYDSYYKAAEYYLKSRADDPLDRRYKDFRDCYDQIIETYIFHIGVKYEDRKLQTELNAGNVSIELREFFKENKYPLSEMVKVEQLDEKRWRIKDEDKVYTIHDQPFSGLYIYIENYPPHPYHYMRRAIVWAAIDMPSWAIGDISRAIELDPGQGKYYRYRGSWLLKNLWKDRDSVFNKVDEKLVYEKVITDYKIASEKNPTDPETWLDLIELNILLHNWDDVIGFYGSSRLYTAQEERLIRSFFGCLALALAGDPIGEEDTRPLYDQTIRINLISRISRITSESFIDKIRSGENYKGKWQKAIEIYKLFIERLDDWEDRGDILGRLECYEEALETYKKAIELTPDRGKWIWEKKGDIFSSLKRYEEAIQSFTMAIELGRSDYYRLWDKKAELLSLMNRYEEAINAFIKLEELNKGFFYYCSIWVQKGACLEKLSRYEEALQVYDKATKDKSTAWYYKGILCEKLNRYEEALNAFDKAIKNISIPGKYDDYDNWKKAWQCKVSILEKLGRHEEARQVFDEAENLRSVEAKKWYELARESAFKGSKSDVRWRLSNAIELDTKYKDLAKKNAVFKTLWDDEDFKRIVG